MSDTTNPPAAPRGGTRPGSGRKPTRPEGSERWEAWVTPEERGALQSHLASIRAGQAPLYPWAYLLRGFDAAQQLRREGRSGYLSLSDGGEWEYSPAPFAEEVQLRVPEIGPVELIDDTTTEG